MAIARPRHERQTGDYLEDIQFDELQVTMLRSIKNDNVFVDDIYGIARVYGYLCRTEPDKLSTADLEATLKDLKENATTLTEKLAEIPQSVAVALWGVSYRRESAPVTENLRILLGYLIEEIEGVLDKEPGSGNLGQPLTANWYAANSLVRCFNSYGLPVNVNQSEDSAMTPAMSCLELIFESSGRHLSRDEMAEYMKAPRRNSYQ